MSLKDDLLRQADDDLALTRALVGLDDEAMGRPCLGAWGVREILAHITGWQREMIEDIGRIFSDYADVNFNHHVVKAQITASLGLRLRRPVTSNNAAKTLQPALAKFYDFGRLGVGGLDRPEHFPGFANEHDAPAALHPAGERGGASLVVQATLGVASSH
jgi:hypothetical protein